MANFSLRNINAMDNFANFQFQKKTIMHFVTKIAKIYKVTFTTKFVSKPLSWKSGLGIPIFRLKKSWVPPPLRGSCVFITSDSNVDDCLC